MKARKLAALFCLALLTGARSRDEERTPRSPEILTQVPAPDRSRVSPLAGNPDALGAGQKLYGRHCMECHGAAGTGGKKGPRLNTREVREASPGALFWVLTNGAVRSGMPVWSKLPEPQRWQIVEYLKSLEDGSDGS